MINLFAIRKGLFRLFRFIFYAN